MNEEIKEFINYIEIQRLSGNKKYKIYQDLLNMEDKIDIISDLKVTVENGILLFNDKNNKLYENVFIPIAMVIKNIKDIEYIGELVILKVKNGEITIGIV